MAHRQSVYFSDRAMEALEGLPQDVQFAGRVNEVIIRYAELITAGRVSALEKLSADERVALRSLLGRYRLDGRTAAEVNDLLLVTLKEEATRQEHLAGLVAKIEGMHNVERLALGEWVQLGEGVTPRQLVKQILELNAKQQEELLGWIASKAPDSQ